MAVLFLAILCYTFYNIVSMSKKVLLCTLLRCLSGGLTFAHRLTQNTSVQNHDSYKCWNCMKTVTDKIFCKYCNTIQPLRKDLDSFTYLELDTNYSINKAKLKQTFLRIQVCTYTYTILNPDFNERVSKNWIS